MNNPQTTFTPILNNNNPNKQFPVQPIQDRKTMNTQPMIQNKANFPVGQATTANQISRATVQLPTYEGQLKDTIKRYQERRTLIKEFYEKQKLS